MKKKILLSLALVVALSAGLVGFSAYEAHIINVTAKIENALSVSPDEIMFGTVFPQELLHKNLDISLSESFLEEDRVDDIQYKIVQKLKPVPEQYEGALEDLSELRDATGELVQVDSIYYPSLCGYLSKHKVDVDEEQEEVEINAFHNGRMWTGSHVMYDGIASGYLTKEGEDTTDEWDIDLAVPCFNGMCDQGWEAWVEEINSEAVASEFVLPTDLEHETFGCDLWVEVTGVSTNYLDMVDVGNPDSEEGHGLAGWGPIEPDTNDGGWGGYGSSPEDEDLRVVYAAEEGTDNSGKTATLTLDFGSDSVSSKKLLFNVLDGADVDDFKLYIDGVEEYDYDAAGGGENWVEHQIDITGMTGIHTITFETTDYNTPGTWNYFDPYGHLGVDWLKVVLQ